MKISTINTTNHNVSLQSDTLTETKTAFQGHLNTQSESQSQTLVTISSNLPQAHLNEVNNPSPVYQKPIVESAPNTSENETSLTPSMTRNESIDNSDDVSEEDTDSKQQNEASPTSALSEADANEQSDNEFTEEELALIDSLKQREKEVEAHERAHAVVGGQYAGTPSYDYQTGPDGVKYAVSGEVSIDVSKVAGDPQATLRKAQQIKSAALAPAEPSGQDRKVAVKADRMAMQARNDIIEENLSQQSNENSGTSKSDQSIYDTSIPEHFNGQDNRVNSEIMDNETQMEMHNRNTHINALYENSTKVLANSQFSIHS